MKILKTASYKESQHSYSMNIVEKIINIMEEQFCDFDKAVTVLSGGKSIPVEQLESLRALVQNRKQEMDQNLLSISPVENNASTVVKKVKKAEYKKIIVTEKFKKAFPEGHYKSDEDISNEFSGMTINNIEIKTPSSGWIELSFPESGEHVGGGASEVTDSWIKYKHNGKIAFDNWYPDNIHAQLVSAIEAKLKNNPVAFKKQL